MSLVQISANEGEALTGRDLQKAISNIGLNNNGFFLKDCTIEELNKLTESLKSFNEMNYGEYSDDEILEFAPETESDDEILEFAPEGSDQP